MTGFREGGNTREGSTSVRLWDWTIPEADSRCVTPQLKMEVWNLGFVWNLEVWKLEFGSKYAGLEFGFCLDFGDLEFAFHQD